MLETLRNPGLFIVKTGTIIGGIYVARGYMRERLEDVREKMEEERRAKENLRTRFNQTHEDIAYTILALLPTLSEQVLQDMDVDSLTRELQARSRARAAKVLPARPPSSLASSIVEIEGYPPSPYPPISRTDADVDARSDAGSIAQSSETGSTEERTTSVYHTTTSASFISETTSVTRSWVVDVETVERSRSPAASAMSGGISETSSAAGDDRMSESIISTTTTNSLESSDTRTKAELWNELKLLTFTRTLTTLYASTLLCLLTTLQLTLLARGKYVNAVVQAEKQEQLEERMRERVERELSPANLLLKGASGWIGGLLGREDSVQASLESLLESIGLDKEFDPTEDEDVEVGDRAEKGIWLGEISDELESKYLTMSWWLLHVGWKDVGERVRRAAEEVFNGVSLKTKLSAVDLHRLIADVRRRVEHEITFEGNEKKTTFLSSLLPPTPETIYHVLTQGGYTASSSTQPLPNPKAASTSHQGASTGSITSSQLSQSFVDSPALGVSTHLPGSAVPTAHPPTYIPVSPAPQYATLLDPPFLALLDETRTILGSPDFARVLEVSLETATATLFEGLERNLFRSEDGGEGEGERIRLAGLLPGLARWSHLALEGLPNELVDKILNQREVACLSALTFAKFEDIFQ
ncbi:hypothetical protein BDN70DRAFT_874009 [Pholiota conissans]|uniref:Peroxin-3 n=1 Tax=Pholiota conissans TaxID=109636 RepID=A0A9P5Z8B6_9AGAR|nr:hypothetical protein BDN70DRAFT_874009 [Pholiota conissans]